MLTMAPPLTSGTITFFELLSLLYPLANEQDLATFKSWCYPEEPKQKIKYVLSAEQRAELKEMFRIIDKDRSGELLVAPREGLRLLLPLPPLPRPPSVSCSFHCFSNRA